MRNRRDAMTTAVELAARYNRIELQLTELFRRTPDPIARMATAAALLHHKMPHYFWTGFYRLTGGELLVGPYQGPLACAVLDRHRGVCWTCLERDAPVLVPDVHAFPGHIPCDERSQSEVVVPLKDGARELKGVLDVDASERGAFSETDVRGLLQIAALIYA
jgi:L-methionine (R)-S-oxide reductase